MEWKDLNVAMARKVYDPNEESSDQDSNLTPNELQLVTQSRELYTNFIREQISLQGLSPPEDMPQLV